MRITFVSIIAGFFWPVAMQGQASPQIVTGPTCDACRVSLELIATVGDAEGQGMLDSSFNSIVRDSRGRTWLWSPDAPYFWVFDADGTLIRRIGRRGEGPGEYQRITSIVLDAADSAYVFDSGLARLTRYGPDLDVAHSVSVELSRDIGKAVFVGGELVVNAGVRSPSGIGYPLHLLDRTGRVRRSFGSTTGEYRPDLREIVEQRAIGADRGDGLWAAWINQYVIEQWDTSGELLRVLQRETEWFPAWWETRSGPDLPPSPHIRDLAISGDTLWTVIVVPGAAWQRAVRPEGRFYIVEDYDLYHDSVIEAIDPQRGEVIVSERFPWMVAGFAAPGIAFGRATDEIGNPVVPIWRIVVSDGR